jgi:hypothetical protein
MGSVSLVAAPSLDFAFPAAQVTSAFDAGFGARDVDAGTMFINFE